MTNMAKVELLKGRLLPRYASGCVFGRYFAGKVETHRTRECPNYSEEKTALQQIWKYGRSYNNYTACFHCGLPQRICSRHNANGIIVSDCEYKNLLKSFLAIGFASESRRSRLSVWLEEDLLVDSKFPALNEWFVKEAGAIV